MRAVRTRPGVLILLHCCLTPPRSTAPPSFHPCPDFDGTAHSCRRQLALHNERRRKAYADKKVPSATGSRGGAQATAPAPYIGPRALALPTGPPGQQLLPGGGYIHPAFLGHAALMQAFGGYGLGYSAGAQQQQQQQAQQQAYGAGLDANTLAALVPAALAAVAAVQMQQGQARAAQAAVAQAQGNGGGLGGSGAVDAAAAASQVALALMQHVARGGGDWSRPS